VLIFSRRNKISIYIPGPQVGCESRWRKLVAGFQFTIDIGADLLITSGGCAGAILVLVLALQEQAEIVAGLPQQAGAYGLFLAIIEVI